MDAGHARRAKRRCRDTKLDKGYRAHNTNVYKQRAGPALPLLYRRRHVRDGHCRQVEAEADLALDQFAALYRLHAYGGAAVRPRPA